MKNLDIEKLERKNIYTTPNNFFENVQENVLQKTVYQLDKNNTVSKEDSTKVIKLNWWYAAAAAVVMIFGATFFFNNNEEQPPTIAQNTQPQNTPPAIVKTVANVEPNEPKQSKENYKTLKEDLNPSESVIQEVKPKQKQQISIAKNEQPKKATVQTLKADEQVEMILASFSKEEIAAISKNTEQDIYLDLYN